MFDKKVTDNLKDSQRSRKHLFNGKTNSNYQSSQQFPSPIKKGELGTIIVPSPLEHMPTFGERPNATESAEPDTACIVEPDTTGIVEPDTAGIKSPKNFIESTHNS